MEHTCLEGGLWPFPLPHPMTNGYPYHQRWFPDVDGHCHCWSNSRKYGVANINDNNTRNNDGCLGEDTIICWAGTMQWFHSPCYWNVWVFSFLFWFIFYHFCTKHYCTSSTIFFSLLNACFLLLTTHVHSLAVCIITIHQRAATFGRGSSSLPYIIATAPLSLTNLWKMTTFSS